jgi:exodeoxyribonuclease V beta subunit
MSIELKAIDFPLHGSRLIEASAGTGKTWTIAALYLRLVLGHGADNAYGAPLMPADILVMTFTRAATRELSNRVRERLIEAAAYFRGEEGKADPYLAELASHYADDTQRHIAARRLMLAAETMDEAAIFTIDAWCQRMLREHAFDSGSLFDEELVSDEQSLFNDAANDYWRQQVYPLNANALQDLLDCWPDTASLKQSVRELVRRVALLGDVRAEPLAGLIARVQRKRAADLALLKAGWFDRANEMEQWIAAQRTAQAKCFNGNKLRADSLLKWFDALRNWAGDAGLEQPDLTPAAWARLTPEGMEAAVNNGFTIDLPDCFEQTARLQEGLAALDQLSHALVRHASAHIARRMAELKQRSRQFGFADMLDRLKHALEGANGTALRDRIVAQYPVAMVDEFQDTSSDQYRIFDLLYRVAENARERGLFLIGDPKQSIYGFRGADIHSYLEARAATEGRHYQLGTNHRSTQGLVSAVNQLFMHAEQGFSKAAFRFKTDKGNPLPFVPVGAAGRAQRFVSSHGDGIAMLACCTLRDDLRSDQYRSYFAHHCAEHIASLLNDVQAGFEEKGGFTRLLPADIAILVRDRKEAAAIRQALQARNIASVYLSDKDSVIDSVEAQDILRWLQAMANPLDGALARAAFATPTAGLPLAELARLVADELAWEQKVEQLKALHLVWQRQGVLAMLRRFVHELGLPAKLLLEVGGERRLTNLLHLAELLQAASTALDGEQALIRWLAEQIKGLGEGGDERVLRLESDAALVKVVTVHKSKGLEYPLVYLPFAVSARKADKRNRSFLEYAQDGKRQLDLAMNDAALALVDQARIEEDLRLLYVAATRARHCLWLGVAALPSRKNGENKLADSALGYLLGGGAQIAASDVMARWEALRAGADAIAVAELDEIGPGTMLDRADLQAPLTDALGFSAPFERNWTVGSFTSLARQTSAAPMRAQEATLLEEDARPELVRTDDAPWHRFPRGSMPGNFLHEQLEWMGTEGFSSIDDPQFDTRLGQRCERAGWGNRKDDAIAWLRAIAVTTLPPAGVSLSQLTTVLPEMEFWFPSEQLESTALDALCRQYLLPGVIRQPLPDRQLHGMLKGFADLVFEHEGRYWVLDYKSNALGAGDAAYHAQALAVGMASHRYDIQGAIYMLALHRLLRSRLGGAYDPASQLGGALFLFLRGIGNAQTRGCHLIAPDLALLDAMDTLFGGADGL